MNKLVCVMTDKERESVDKKETKIFCTELTKRLREAGKKVRN